MRVKKVPRAPILPTCHTPLSPYLTDTCFLQAGCEWVPNKLTELGLPRFPDFGEFEFTLPPIPRLLPYEAQLTAAAKLPLTGGVMPAALMPTAVVPAAQRSVLVSASLGGFIGLSLALVTLTGYHFRICQSSASRLQRMAGQRAQSK